MTDPKNPHGDEHIEDLLSQLQGIFGRLSSSEEAESKDKIDIPAAPKEPAEPVPQPDEPVPQPISETPVSTPPQAAEPEPLPVPPPFSPPPENPPVVVSPEPETPVPPTPAPAFESSIAAAPDDSAILPTAVFYPADRENQAKTLAQKIELLTPKFTKVAFRLRVQTFRPYDPKSDWKAMFLSDTSTQGLRIIFFVVDRPLDEARRKPLVSQLEAKGIYFHDVPLLSIEKKAFYTDLLLGLVFFFDTQKPPPSNG